MNSRLKIGILIIFILVLSISIPFGYNSMLFAYYERLPETRTTEPIIEGTFIQYTGVSDWNFSMWDTEFQNLDNLGINTVIIQWVHTSETNKTLYQSDIFGFEAISVDSECHAPIGNPYGFDTNPDILNVFFYLAEQYSLNIHIGLTVNWQFGSMIDNPEWVEKEIYTNEVIIGELLEKYGTLASFKGFYLPYEVYQGPNEDGADGIRLGSFFGKLSNSIRTLEMVKLGTQNKNISAAPYVSAPMWLPSTIDFWNKFLDAANLDILMIQDGVGCTGRWKDFMTQVPISFGIIRDSCVRYNVAFWSDLEIFIDTEWSPANIERIIAQLDIESRYADKIVVFDIPHYMSAQFSEDSNELYENYTEYFLNL